MSDMNQKKWYQNPNSWRTKIERSRKVRKPYLDDKELFLNLYCNRAQPSKITHRKDLMQVNYIYSHIRLVSPTIFAGKPKVTVKPRFENDPSVSVNAMNLEKSIDYWVRELGAADEFQSALFDSFFGLAAIEVGWDYRTQIVDEMQPLLHPETGEVVLGQNGLPVMTMAPVERVKSDKPFIRWRDSKDLILDVDVPRRKDGRFMIVRDVVTYEYFQQMTDIPAELRKKVKPTVRPEDMSRREDIGGWKESDATSDMEWVELEWVWCRESMKRYLMTPSLPKEFLLETDWPYELLYEDDPFPITILDNIIDNRYPYSWSEFRPAMEHIRELNRLRTNMAFHIKASQPKYGYVKGSLTRAQASKWANARPDELIEMQNPDGVKQMPIATFPAETTGWNSMVENDLVKLTGLIEYEGAPQSDTATEASIMEGRAQVRKRDRSRKFERFVKCSLAKLGQLIQQNQNENITIQIAGPSGQQWKQVNKEQMKGDFLYDIEEGIMEFKNESLRKQQLLKFVELMSNNPNVNQRLLAEEVSKAFDFTPEKILKRPEEMSPPQPEPSIKIKPIDIKDIHNPKVLAEIVVAALEQNGVIPSRNPPNPASMGQSAPENNIPQININQGRPLGGMTELAPVEGMQDIQSMSEDY